MIKKNNDKKIWNTFFFHNYKIFVIDFLIYFKRYSTIMDWKQIKNLILMQSWILIN